MSNILERIVYQSNPLIESRKHMNLTEQRLLNIAMQGVRPKLSDKANPESYDIDFKEIIVPASEISDLLNANGGSVDNLKKSLSTAFQRAHIEIRFGRGGIILRHIFNKLEYLPNKGLLIQLDPEMKPYLLDLVHKSFTSYSLKYVFPLSSGYGFRIMELMMQYKNMATMNPDADDGSKLVSRYFSLEDLRFKLDVPADKYVGRINNLRIKVLEEPIREINEKTPFSLRYETKKKGRNIVGFWLYMIMPAEALAPVTIENDTGEISDHSTALPSADAVKETSAPVQPAQPANTGTPLKDDYKQLVSDLQKTAQKNSAKSDSLTVPALTVDTSGMSEADFVEHVMHDMKAEGLASGRVKHWIKVYGVDYANALFRYGVKEVDRQGKTGTERINFLAKCMDADWLAENTRRKAERAAERQKKQLSKAEAMEAELLASAKTFSVAYNPAGEKGTISSPAIISTIAQDIKEGSLSITTKRILLCNNLTISEFIKQYMSE